MYQIKCINLSIRADIFIIIVFQVQYTSRQDFFLTIHRKYKVYLSKNTLYIILIKISMNTELTISPKVPVISKVKIHKY